MRWLSIKKPEALYNSRFIELNKQVINNKYIIMRIYRNWGRGYPYRSLYADGRNQEEMF